MCILYKQIFYLSENTDFKTLQYSDSVEPGCHYVILLQTYLDTTQPANQNVKKELLELFIHTKIFFHKKKTHGETLELSPRLLLDLDLACMGAY
jgi:hypothetical protein